MNTVVGVVFDELGHGMRRRFSADAADFWNPIRRDTWATPASEVRSLQSTRIPVNVEHRASRTVGEAIYLERSQRGLVAVAHVDDSLDPYGELYWSAETVHNRHGDADVELTALGIVESTAQIGLRPLRVLHGALDYRGAAERWTLEPSERALLERATVAHLQRRAGEPLLVVDAAAQRSDEPVDVPQRGQVEIRSATTTRVGGRSIDLVVMPYEPAEAIVRHEGRMIRETVARGAFDGIEQRAGTVRVNRDHQRERTVGRVTRLDPRRPEGLVAELHIARTPLGEETLTLAREGCLDASAGFRVLPGGEQWIDRSHRRLTAVWLEHVALTPEPAYLEANVLAVRTGSRRPNLERVLAAMR